MNARLSPEEIDACLDILHRGLVQIRLACWDGDIERAEAIADGLHNLPHLLLLGDRYGWSVSTFRELFLDALVTRYPDLGQLAQRLDEARRGP